MSFLAGHDSQDTMIGLLQAASVKVITPSDTTDVTALTTRGILVGSNGSVHIRTFDNVDIDLGNWTKGDLIPIHVKRVLAATNATVYGLV